MNWDPFQREVLAELGHVLYRQAGDPISPGSEDAHDPVASNSLMLICVARAAGMSPETLQACIGDMQMIASLHGNASAKRALWPRLRALRRQRRG